MTTAHSVSERSIIQILTLHGSVIGELILKIRNMTVADKTFFFCYMITNNRRIFQKFSTNKLLTLIAYRY